jgi:hypothetical protein
MGNDHRWVIVLLASCTVLCGGCAKGSNASSRAQPVGAAASASVVASVGAGAPIGAGTVPGSEKAGECTGFPVGIPQSGEVHGRLLAPGKLERAEVSVSEYDLATNLTGDRLGMAMADERGDFSVRYLSRHPVQFLKIEAVGVFYVSDVDGIRRQIALLNGIVNGLPTVPNARVTVSAATEVMFARFRALVQDGTPHAEALLRSCDEVRGKDVGTGWSLASSPLVIQDGAANPLRSYLLGWEEQVRYDHVDASSFIGGMAADFSDGVWNGVDKRGKSVQVNAEGRGGLKIPATYFSSDFVAAFARYQLCHRTDIPKEHPARAAARCPVITQTAKANSDPGSIFDGNGAGAKQQ